MLNVSPELVEQAIAILGADATLDEQMQARIAALAQEPVLGDRLTTWPQEAFGLVLLAHAARINLPTTFSARNQQGQWIQLDLKLEPIFGIAVQMATAMFHSGPRTAFKNIANRSSVVSAANTLLNNGGTLEGATLSGPALLGIPARIYVPVPRSLWQRLLRR